MIIFYTTLLIFTSNIHADDNKSLKPPKLDLRDFNDTISNNLFDILLSSLIPDTQDENSIRILDSQIDEIKINSSQFEPKPVTANDTINLYTNLGLLKFKFYLEESPKNSLNFKKLANSRFYDKTLFHHVVPKFIIQGGDILTRNGNRFFWCSINNDFFFTMYFEKKDTNFLG